MKIHVLSILAASSLCAAAIGAGFPNGAPADLVLGQTDFTSIANGTSPRLFALTADVAIDPTTGKLFLSDYSNRRILRFASYASLVTNAGAEAARSISRRTAAPPPRKPDCRASMASTWTRKAGSGSRTSTTIA